MRVAAIVLLVSMIGALALTLRPDEPATDEPVADDDTPTIDDLDGAAKELAELLQADRQATFHAVYEVTSSDFAGAAVSFETWRRPPKVRSDIVVTKPDGVVRTRQLLLPDGAIACQQADDTPWQCTRTPEVNDPFQGDILEQVAAAEKVTAEDRVIDGRNVRCFTLTQPDITAEFCATDNGVPVLVQSAGTSLKLVSLEEEVGEVFEPPAEPLA